jgi:hypothetical protein
MPVRSLVLLVLLSIGSLPLIGCGSKPGPSPAEMTPPDVAPEPTKVQDSIKAPLNPRARRSA